MIKKFNAFIICSVMLGCCVIVMSMIILSNVVQDPEQSDNGLVRLLLRGVSIQTTISDSEWLIKYPYEVNGIDRVKEHIEDTQSALNSFCTVSFPGSDKINDIVGHGKRLINYNVSAIHNEYENVEYVKSCVRNVKELQNFVLAEKMPFFYVQTPSIESVRYYCGEKMDGENTTAFDRAKAFVIISEENKIDLIDVARDYPGEMVFDSTKHWMPKDGLRCAGIIAGKLNEKYGFGIDQRVYDIEAYSDLMLREQDLKTEISNLYGYEFGVFVPNFPTSYVLTYAEDKKWEGSFEETVLTDGSEWSSDSLPYHNVFREDNSLIYEYENEYAECDKKILIIGDSFSWPVAAYLSLGVKDVTVLHNASFNGSIVSYIKATKPDAVIMVYNDAEFYETYTEDAFYLK